MVSPPEVTRALAVSAAAHGTTHRTHASVFRCSSHAVFHVSGVQMFEYTSVNRVEVEKGHVTAVETDRGSIECEYFINCAGQVSVCLH